MTQSQQYSGKLPIVWYRRNIAASNQYCLYCGRYLGEGGGLESNREHLIARELVPSGTLGDKSFNFIFRACSICNNEKSDAERHVSSITLLTSPEIVSSPELTALAFRKASKDYHPLHPGRVVIESSEHFQHGTKLWPGVDISFGFIAPPQIVKDKVELLAFRQMQGFVSLMTSTDPKTAEGTSVLHAKHFEIFGYFGHSDWGDVQIVEIVRRTSTWEILANIGTAQGFYKAVIKKSPSGEDTWYWALEWNKSIRVVGALRQQGTTPSIFKDLPNRSWSSTRDIDGSVFRIKLERALSPTDDMMFVDTEST